MAESSAMAIDPTVATLAKLNDPTKYVRVDNVPIFCPHERQLRNGHKLVVTESTLDEIAHNAHERQNGAGQLVRVTLGHIIQDKNTPETKQPRPVGFARITDVGTFGPGHETGLMSTLYIRREDWEEAKTYPFRSAEYYPDNQTITGVALLRRDPELDLGLITYEGGRVCLHYAMEANMPDESFLDGAKLDNKGSDLDMKDQKQADDPEYKKFEGYVSRHPVLNYVCQKYAADAASMPAPTMGDEPGGGNTYMPGMEEDKKQPMSMQRSREALNYERRIQDLEVKYAKEQREKRLLLYRSDLERLQQEGYELDLAAEMEDVKDLTPEQFTRHKNRIARNYQRAPVAYGREPLAIGSSGVEGLTSRDKPLTKAERDAAVQYAADHDCDFGTALAAIKKK